MARRKAQSATELQSVLNRGLAAIAVARQQVSEVCDHLSTHSTAGAEVAAGLSQTLAEVAELADLLNDQWELCLARYKVGERIIQAQEEERRYLAREIHDGPAQSMANVVLRAEICERLLAVGRQELVQELSQLKFLVKESLREVRKIIFDLRPMALDDLGLVPTLRRYLEYLEEQDGLRVALAVTGQERRLPSALEVALFRVIQEAVNNAHRHAQASIIQVQLSFDDKHITASVCDDGVGFDVDQVQQGWQDRPSFGLVNMRERVQLLNGDFEVKSAPGKGTSITARLDYRDTD